MTCKWTSSTTPRILPGRHGEDCTNADCVGCQPCLTPHCRVCAISHAAGACAECMAATREHLREIGRLCGSLPDEVEHRGVEGEAMFLLGPATDAEQWGHREASALAGRISDEYLADATGELHPAWVIGTWSMLYRDALEHDEALGVFNLGVEIDYLDRNLTYVGGYEHVPFEDMARDLGRCVGHLEAVLHDGEQVDRGAPCLSCGAHLERTWGTSEKEDGWKCPKCKRTSTDAQYRLVVAQLHRDNATHLTDQDMQIRTGLNRGTIRSWARHGLVGKQVDAGRVLYSVEDVLDTARSKGLVA